MNSYGMTINLHITNYCNMRCKGCYSHMYKNKNLKEKDWIKIIEKLAKELKEIEIKKINFVGGEPTLVPYLPNLVKKAKDLGFTTSIVTNGYLITKDYLKKFDNSLDLIGLSVDSLKKETLLFLGRHVNYKILDYYKICFDIKEQNISLKINTMVSNYNYKENFTEFITKIKPIRWKVFQFLPIKGENDLYTPMLSINKEKFGLFKNINKDANKVCPVIYEDNHTMIGSYIMVDSEGYPFTNINYKIKRGLNLLEYELLSQLDELKFDFEKFKQRGGIYQIVK